MSTTSPKYSIIIPTYNGIKYLPACVETVISQDYSDYELLISDDHSTDGTREFLKSLDHSSIRVLYPTESLSMTEHWEWALSHAKGDWQIFVGQDDGLQPYFFQLADKLTNVAENKSIRTIMSSRAYFFWSGCEYVYGDLAVEYLAKNIVKILSFEYEALKALFGFQAYFELPQMYTTALFHRSLLDEARSKQEGKVFTCHPQDANLAAIACSLEKKYLKSYIPLGWVGSSPKSAGMAISGATSFIEDEKIQKKSEVLKKEYLRKVSKSKLKYHEWAGEFSFGSISLYFWQALLMTQHLRSERSNSKIKSKAFKIILFSSILYTKKFSNSKKSVFQHDQFNYLLEINGCNKQLVTFTFLFILLFAKPCGLAIRVVRRIRNALTFDKVRLRVCWHEDGAVSMKKVSPYICDKLKVRGWF